MGDCLVMCCICFERVMVASLDTDDDGHLVDVCVRCGFDEREDAARAALTDSETPT
jgi:hypothetical protein